LAAFVTLSHIVGAKTYSQIEKHYGNPDGADQHAVIHADIIVVIVFCVVLTVVVSIIALNILGVDGRVHRFVVTPSHVFWVGVWVLEGGCGSDLI
jgi:hypothetical protein